MQFLQRLGRRIRARRKVLGRNRFELGHAAEISGVQVTLYETGQGHPPAFTLHRIARALATTSSALLGENDTFEHDVDILVQLYNDPMIGKVTRIMQDMTRAERKTVQRMVEAMAAAEKPAEKAAVMTVAP